MIEVIRFEKHDKIFKKKIDHRFNTLVDMKNWKKAVEVMTGCKMYLIYQEV